jgi:hypothetical protein
VVEYRVLGTQTWIALGQPIATGTTSVAATGLANNTSYQFRVRNTRNPLGTTVSNLATGIRNTSTTCSPPTGVSVVRTQVPDPNGMNGEMIDQLNFTLTQPATVPTGYRITWERTGGTPVNIPTTGQEDVPAGTNLIINTFLPDGDYTGTVRSICGATATSIAVNFTTSAVTPPMTTCTAPVLISALIA